MMKLSFAVLFLLLLGWWAIPVAGEIEHLVSPAATQIEHAPTPEQCRADADAWGIPTPALLINTEEQFNQFSRATTLDKSLSANMLDARTKELSQCIRTDKPNSMRYAEASRAYAIAQLVRIASFMKRHNLYSQFLAEDEQGQR
jgi:hypothetical protein